MAFVIRSEKTASHIRSQTSKEVGPGSYLGPEKLHANENIIPFNSSNERAEQPKIKDVTPGPGQYNIEQPYLNEKVVVSSANEDIKIVEVPKPQSMFKSNASRFKNQKDEFPGPGSYNVGQGIEIIKKQWPESQYKKDVLDQLMQMNKYQPIPSIPSKLHIFGYTENENNDLELNKLPDEIHRGVKDDQIGPGHYEFKGGLEQSTKGTDKWSKNLETRFRHQRQSKSVGPGHYDVQTQFMPLYKFKQNSGFASKTLRPSEQRKGSIANSFLKQKSVMSSDSTMRTRGGTDFEDSDSEYEYIEETTPGPGYYNWDNTIKAINPQTKREKFQLFGSSQVRFKEPNRISHTGPGDYKGAEKTSFNITGSKLRNKKVPFLSSNTRFEIKAIQEQKPGPTTYDPKLSLEDKLVTKVQKGYRGKFGTTDRRFKPSGLEEYPGPGAYLDPILEKEEDIQPSMNFKSKVKRGEFTNTKEHAKKPPIGAYNLDYFDINKNIHKDDEEDVDLKIPYPAFGSSTKNRFPDIKTYEKQLQDEDDEDYESYPRNRPLQENLLKKQKQGVRFGSKAERFSLKKPEENPGPGKYHDPNSNPWNKRTYNILFAEI